MYNFINTTFNETTAIGVYWNNSELIIVLLILIMFIQAYMAALLSWAVFSYIYK